jgi:hypothetical protein
MCTYVSLDMPKTLQQNDGDTALLKNGICRRAFRITFVYMHTIIHIYVHTYIHTYKQTNRQTDRQTDRSRGKKVSKWKENFSTRLFIFPFLPVFIRFLGWFFTEARKKKKFFFLFQTFVNKYIWMDSLGSTNVRSEIVAQFTDRHAFLFGSTYPRYILMHILIIKKSIKKIMPFMIFLLRKVKMLPRWEVSTCLLKKKFFSPQSGGYY